MNEPYRKEPTLDEQMKVWRREVIIKSPSEVIKTAYLAGYNAGLAYGSRNPPQEADQEAA